MVDIQTKRRISGKIIGIILLALVLIAVVAGVVYKGTAKNSIPSTFAISAKCPSKPAASARFCLESPAVVLVSTPGNTNQFDLSAPSSELGLWPDAVLAFKLSNVKGPISVANFSKVPSEKVAGTITVSYKEFSVSVGSNGLDMFYAGNGEMGVLTTSVVRAVYTPITINTELQVQGEEVVITTKTININGRTLPPIAVPGRPGSPSAASIPPLPPGMRYTGVKATKQGLIFHIAGSNESLGSLLPKIAYQGTAGS